MYHPLNLRSSRSYLQRVAAVVVLSAAVIIHGYKIQTEATVRPCLEYRDISAGLSFTTEREPVSYHSYVASDGTRVSGIYFYYHSSKKANKELRRRLIPAVQITQRGPKLNSKGQKIGMRVIGVFRSRASSVNEFEVLWTDGSNLNILSGPSLPILLQFEEPNCRKQ